MISMDGLDATDKLVRMLRKMSFDAPMLAEVSFAGFNLVDPNVVFERCALEGSMKKLGPVYEVVKGPIHICRSLRGS